MQLVKGRQQIGTSSRFDLLKYLDIDYSSCLTPNEIQNFDILKWWRFHEVTFFVLSKMTCDIFTLPTGVYRNISMDPHFSHVPLLDWQDSLLFVKILFLEKSESPLILF